MDIINRIAFVGRTKGYSQGDICEAIGLNKRNFTAWRRGESKSYLKYLDEIAELLGVTKEYLLTGEEVAPELNGDNFVWVGEIKKVPSVKIPLLGYIACGEPITAIENVEEMIYPPYGSACDFALTCSGDSMVDAGINSGDIVFIKKQPDVENGEIAAVLIGNDTTLKKVYKYEDKVVLHPCNQKYQDMVITEDMRIIGKAVSLQRKVI